MKIIRVVGVVCLVLGLWSGASINRAANQSVKCMVQTTNYYGEGAYLVVSLINPQGVYEQTLYVLGEDEEWYPDLKEWFPFFEEASASVDGISGASVAGGERAICVLGFEESKIDAGYKLRFETAVENQKYYVDDVELALTTENMSGKFEGKGYIRYIRLLPN